MIVKEKYCERVKTKISHVLSLKTIDFKLYKEFFMKAKLKNIYFPSS